jgi:[acyl-carrier-protein] S-malonyltransferase
MDCAMLFPGQASHHVGMGKDYYDAFGDVRDMYKSANRVLGFDIMELSFAGDLDELTKTHNAQPAILLHSLAVFTVLSAQGFQPKVVAGHSLGEFSALVAAGYFRPMDALLIVRKRGELMYEAGLEEPGTMAAIIGLNESGVQALCSDAASEGIVVIANYNSPEQFAISGEVAAVDKAVAIAKDAGAKRAIRLQVSGAFHSPLMTKTAEALTAYIKKFETGKLKVTWIPNVTGEVAKNESVVTDFLSKQLSSPVRWVTSMQQLVRVHDGPILEVGPGKVLSGLMKRIDRARSVYPVTDTEGLARAQEVFR